MKLFAIYPAIAAVLALSACSDTSQTNTQTTPDVAAEIKTEPVKTETTTLTYGDKFYVSDFWAGEYPCLLYTSPSPRDRTRSRMPSSA